MKVNPVKKYEIPAYPTKQEVLNNPRLLRENLPTMWRHTPQLAGAVALLLTANACTSVCADVNKHLTRPEIAIVAPLFEHGEGRGSFGCIAVAPPNFLSEEEAIQVIIDELGYAGISVSQENVEFPGVLIPQRERYYWEENGAQKSGVREIPQSGKALNVDLLNNEKLIAIEYLSRDDYFELGGVWSASTALGYDFQEVSEGVGEAVEEQGDDMYFGTFYDPLVKWNFRNEMDYDEEKLLLQEQAKQLLREQVKDFLDWLEAQGTL